MGKSWYTRIGQSHRAFVQAVKLPRLQNGMMFHVVNAEPQSEFIKTGIEFPTYVNLAYRKNEISGERKVVEDVVLL